MIIITGRCCTDWPLILGIPPKKCGKCGQVPEIVAGTEREVEDPK